MNKEADIKLLMDMWEEKDRMDQRELIKINIDEVKQTGNIGNLFFECTSYGDERKSMFVLRMQCHLVTVHSYLVPATDFADASHSKSAKSATATVSYGIFSSENAYL